MPFLFFSCKGDNRDIIFVHSCTLFCISYIFAHDSGRLVLLHSMLEGPNKLSANRFIHTLEGFCCSVIPASVVFSLFFILRLISRLWLIYFSITFISQVYRIISPYIFRIIFISFYLLHIQSCI